MPQTAPSPTAPLPRFFAWWGAELASAVPAGIRSLARGSTRYLRIEIGPETWELRLGGNGKTRSVGRIDAGGGDLVNRLRAATRNAKRRKSLRILEIAAGLALSTTMRLPQAAMENLREVVGFEMDRVTPFAPQDAYYTCQALGRNGTNGHVDVAVTIVPRKLVDDALATARRAGLRPTRVEIADTTSPFDVAGLHQTRGGGTLLSFLFLLALGLGASSLGIPLWKKQIVLENLESQIAGAQAAAQAAAVLDNRLRNHAASQTFLIAERDSQPATTLLLADLTRRLDDSTWIRRLTLSKGKIRVDGVSGSASGLLKTLESSPHFSAARFDSSVVEDRATGAERFSVSATLTQGAVDQ